MLIIIKLISNQEDKIRKRNPTMHWIIISRGFPSIVEYTLKSRRKESDINCVYMMQLGQSVTSQ